LNPSFTYYFPDTSNKTLVNFVASPQTAGLTYQWFFFTRDNYLAGNPLEYQFNSGGTYQVYLQVTDSALFCSEMVVQNVSVPIAPPPIEPCDTSSLSIGYAIDGSDPAQYSFTTVSHPAVAGEYWLISLLNGFNDSIALNSINPVYTFTDTGVYNICVFAVLQNGCSINACTTIDVSTLKAPEPGAGVHIPAYPNPATNVVELSVPLSSAATITITVYDTHGLKVYSAQSAGVNGMNTIDVPVQGLQAGEYFIDIDYNGEHKRSGFEKI
jgi:PKD repeat protein